MSSVTLDRSAPMAARGTDWQPYLIGTGIGLLSIAAFALVNNPIGITTSLAQVAGGVATPVLGAEAVAQNAYWKTNPLKLDYGTLFLVGTLVGGFLSALMQGGLRLEKVPAVWAERFGPSPMKRYAGAFVGGILAMYGARMANGCTSGNGISGGLQLALSGWVFMAAMFAGGLATALILFGRR